MKSVCLLLALTILFGQCNNKNNARSSFAGVNLKKKVNALKNGKVITFPKTSITEAKAWSLTTEQVESLINLLTTPDNFGPSDRNKKCRFEPDIQFNLGKVEDKRVIDIQFCVNCRTWKLTYNDSEYFGNYDNGHKVINNFLQGFLVQPKTEKNYLLEESDSKNLKKLFGDSLYHTLIKQSIQDIYVSIPRDSGYVNFDSKGRPIDVSTIRLKEDQTKQIHRLLQTANLYNLQDWVRICDQPISAFIQIEFTNHENMSVFLSEQCEQATFKIGNEGRTLFCPELIQKFNHFYSNLKTHEN